MQRIANPSSRIRMHRFESCTLRQLKACCKSRLFCTLFPFIEIMLPICCQFMQALPSIFQMRIGFWQSLRILFRQKYLTFFTFI